ncbi:uncharacterized protein PG998_004965 [Apiospora kogelbergensis]|uniref:uncharacterized protein n=1 Tax=Apiospora kogelbergensis TaxID=1337665 RepID=UPI003130D367
MEFSQMLRPAAARPFEGQRGRSEHKTLQYTILRDSCSLSTWLAIGAVGQGLLVACLPFKYAVLPAQALLGYRLGKALLMHGGLLKNSQAEGVIQGKFTAQVPGPDGAVPTLPSENPICLLVLAARSNGPLGIFAPGFREVGKYMESMRAALEDGDDGVNHGFLCQTMYLAANERPTANQLMMMCYFRSADDAHAFAHGQTHRKAWEWWVGITQRYPHLSIRHELYDVPAGHWENISINSHPAGLSGMNAPVRCEGGWTRPLFDARKLNLRTTMGRLGHTDGSDNEKYGPEPY